MANSNHSYGYLHVLGGWQRAYSHSSRRYLLAVYIAEPFVAKATQTQMARKSRRALRTNKGKVSTERGGE